MSRIIYCTAASLRAMLQYIDPAEGPKIAYDNDLLAIPLVNKVKSAVGDSHGNQNVTISFSNEETDIQKQFEGVAILINDIFNQLVQNNILLN